MTGCQQWLGFVAAACLSLGVGLGAGRAAAQGRVQARVTDAEGRPIDATVTLAGNGRRFACRTVAARCTIVAPAGTYTATLAPVRGAPPPPRAVRVPARGAVSLAMRARPAPRGAVVARKSAVRPAPLGGLRAHKLETRTRGRVVARPGQVATPTRRPVPQAGVVRPSVARVPVRATAAAGARPPARPRVMGVTRAAGPSARSATRNLGAGRTLRVQGSITDAAGRPTNGTVTVRGRAGVVGTAPTTAGRFALFDLAPGTYTVSVRGTHGGSAQRSITVGPAIQRVAIRLR